MGRTFKRRRPNWASGLILVLSSVFAVGTVLAESPKTHEVGSLYDQEFVLALGGFFPRISTDVSLSGSSGQGTEVSGDDLGLNETSPSAWLSFNWRFLPRHKIHLEYFQLNQEGNRSAGRDFNFGSSSIGFGASLDSELNLGLGRFTYGYSFIRKEKLDVQFQVGFHVATAKVTVTAAGNVRRNGVPVRGRSVTESSSTMTFPLPHIGGSVSYRFTPRVSANFTALFFTLDLGQYSGSLIELDALGAYQITEHFGVGGGLKYFNVNLQNNVSGGGSAEFDYGFFGPALFVYGSF